MTAVAETGGADDLRRARYMLNHLFGRFEVRRLLLWLIMLPRVGRARTLRRPGCILTMSSGTLGQGEGSEVRF